MYIGLVMQIRSYPLGLARYKMKKFTKKIQSVSLGCTEQNLHDSVMVVMVIILIIITIGSTGTYYSKI